MSSMRFKVQIVSVCVFAAFASPALAASFAFDDVEFWVGSGANCAAIAIDWVEQSTVEPALVWGYRWDGTASGRDMLTAVVAADDRLFAKLGNSSANPVRLYGLGYDSDDDGEFVPATNSNARSSTLRDSLTAVRFSSPPRLPTREIATAKAGPLEPDSGITQFLPCRAPIRTMAATGPTRAPESRRSRWSMAIGIVGHFNSPRRRRSLPMPKTRPPPRRPIRAATSIATCWSTMQTTRSGRTISVQPSTLPPTRTTTASSTRLTTRFGAIISAAAAVRRRRRDSALPSRRRSDLSSVPCVFSGCS